MSWDKGFGGLTREAATLPLVRALAAARTVPTELTEPGTGASTSLLTLSLPRPHSALLGEHPLLACIRSYPSKEILNDLRPCSSLSSSRYWLQVLVVASRTEALSKSLRKSLLAAGQATQALLASYFLPKSLLAAGSGSGIAPLFAVGGIFAVSRIQPAWPDAAPVGVGGWR